MRYEELTIEGRNAVLEAFRSGKTIDKLFVLDGCQDGPVRTILREAKKHDTIVQFVKKERLDQLSQTGHHQGVIASAAAYEYAEISDILQNAKDKGEAPFIIFLDNIEDPHNLGAIIRTANLAGAHGVVIPKRRAVGLTATVARVSAGALNYTPVAKVTNIGKTIEELKAEGMWFVCADMDGEMMYNLDLKGPIGLVIGNEGEGVSRLVKEKCDFVASIPMKGDIDSLNASVAAGVLAFEIVRITVGMAVFQFIHECTQQPYSDLVCSVIVITVSWEVSFDLIIGNDSAFITNRFYFCILDCGQRVYYM